jgi:antitoxin component of MazEF toxin-antitoxin module
MEARLQKLRNSSDFRILSKILKSLNIKNNDKLELVQEDDKIIITKSKNNKISLKKNLKIIKNQILLNLIGMIL